MGSYIMICELEIYKKESFNLILLTWYKLWNASYIPTNDFIFLQHLSLKSFLVLYEENDLNFLSLHSLANFTSLLAGPLVKQSCIYSSSIMSKKSWQVISLQRIFSSSSSSSKSRPRKNEISPSVSYCC